MFTRVLALVSGALLGLATSNALAQGLPAAKPEEIGLSAAKLQRLTDAFQAEIDKGAIPGAVLLVARNGKVGYFKAIGFQDRVPDQADRDGSGHDAGRGRQDPDRRSSCALPSGVIEHAGRCREDQRLDRQAGTRARASAPADDGAGFAAPHLRIYLSVLWQLAGQPGLWRGERLRYRYRR